MGDDLDASRAVGPAPAPVPITVPVDAPAEVAAALDGLGRTEDVCFSPDGNRLAISAFGARAVALVELDRRAFDAHLDRGDAGPPPAVRIGAMTRLHASGLAAPHGVAFLDAETIVVANREGGITVHPVPPPGPTTATATATLQDDHLGLRAPGSVRLGPTGDGTVAAFVCDNGIGTVTRHAVDPTADGLRLGPPTTVVARWLDIPDGVAVSPDGRWLAVSNHNTQSVLVYRTGPELGADAVPDAVLLGVAYPHGLTFLPDGRHLVVADAGRPHLHVFAADPAGWSGVGAPVASHRVMDDDTFRRGRPSLLEGGPKGIDCSPDGRLLAVTSELRALQLVSAAALLLGPGEAGPARRLDAEHARLEHEAGRDRVIADHIAREFVLEQERAAAEQRAVAAEQRAAEAALRAAVAEREARTAAARAAAYEQTLTLRLTRPARRLYGRLRRPTRTPGAGTPAGSAPTPDHEEHSP